MVDAPVGSVYKGQTMAPSRCAGASVLCYTVDDRGRRQYLLGQDADGQMWSDFGGGCKRLERSASCAARELKEETHGVVQRMCGGHLRHVDLTRLCPSVRFQFNDYRNNPRHYTTYLLAVPLDSRVSRKFQQSRRLVRCAHLSPGERKARLEKCAMEYTSLLDGFTLRPFFQTRLRHILPILDEMTHSATLTVRRHTVNLERPP